MLIDTHAHLNFASYKDDIDDVMQRIIADGMKVINVGSQFSTSERAVKLADQYPDTCYAAVGLHPIHLFEMEVDESELPFITRQEEFVSEKYEQLASHHSVVAIGEMGIDYFHFPPNISQHDFEYKQRWTLLKGIKLAKKLQLPLILHCRGGKGNEEKAYRHMLQVLKEGNYHNAVLHCYSSTWDIAKKFLSVGYMISFAGIVTYPKTKELEKVVKNTPLDRIMIETDAPYLAPQFVRGKRNEPRFVRYIADRIAEIKKLSFEEVEDITTQNAIKFFQLK